MIFFARVKSKLWFSLLSLVVLIYGGYQLRNKFHDIKTTDRKSIKNFDRNLTAENHEIMQQVKILDEMHLAISEEKVSPDSEPTSWAKTFGKPITAIYKSV